MSDSHRTQTVVRHWIELHDDERLTVTGWNNKERLLVALYAEVIDGTVSTITGTSLAKLKSGALGAGRREHFYRGHEAHTAVGRILAARGLPVGGES